MDNEKHVHGWAIIGKWANCVAQWNCAAALSPEEIDRRINVIERLRTEIEACRNQGHDAILLDHVANILECACDDVDEG